MSRGKNQRKGQPHQPPTPAPKPQPQPRAPVTEDPLEKQKLRLEVHKLTQENEKLAHDKEKARLEKEHLSRGIWWNPYFWIAVAAVGGFVVQLVYSTMRFEKSEVELKRAMLAKERAEKDKDLAIGLKEKAELEAKDTEALKQTLTLEVALLSKNKKKIEEFLASVKIITDPPSDSDSIKLRGKVVDKSGEGIGNARVIATTRSNEGLRRSFESLTTSDGRFELWIPNSSTLSLIISGALGEILTTVQSLSARYSQNIVITTEPVTWSF